MPTFNDGTILPSPLDVEPLFLSMDDLKARLRLSGAASTDALAIIDSAVQKVRAGFMGVVTQSRINQILNTLPVPNATTREEAIRNLATATEVLWVRYILMQELPQLWIDGSGNSSFIWNQEGLTREGVFDTSKEKQKLWKQIQEMLQQLISGELLSTTSNDVLVIGASTPQPRPGQTVNLPYSYALDYRHRI